MARYHFLGIARDTFGNVEPNHDISVFLNNTSTGAIVYSAEVGGTGVSAAPQLTTDEYGRFDFWVDDNDYILTQLFDVESAGLTYDGIEIMRGAKVHHGLGELDDDDHGVIYPGINQTETITGRWTFQFPLSGGPRIELDNETIQLIGRCKTLLDYSRNIFDELQSEIVKH